MTDEKDLEARVVELEIQLAYANERVTTLDDALREQSGQVATLTEELRLLKEAVRRVARPAEGNNDVLADHEDPVPSSG
jgi:uncharacterized coiled-coil protein SlyX